MNDDLNLIITILTNQKESAYIALTIPHGFNNPFWSANYMDFNEPHVFKAYMSLLPLHCQTLTDVILQVDQAFEIVQG